MGYTLPAAESGWEGLKVLEEGRAEIVALVVDVTVPGVGGLETLAALRERRPGLPAVLMSGSEAAKLSARETEGGPTRFVPKPPTGAALRTALRAILERPSRA